MPDDDLRARSAALNLLDGVLADGAALPELSGQLSGLSPQDRARANRLSVTTLRHLGRADATLKPFLRRPPQGRVLNILRLATVELRQDGQAAHGVVDSAVRLVKSIPHSKHFAGLVNAVLRKVADVPDKKWAAMPPGQLAEWIRTRLLSTYGVDAVRRIEEVHAATPPTDLTFKPGRGPDMPGHDLPGGGLRLNDPGQITALPGFSEGNWWVQDFAAAVPARLLGAQPGQDILDLCAAPGGKTLQLAAAGARVTAVDISQERLKTVRENLDRCGLEAELVALDALRVRGRKYDAVLLDAPCSASGTIRRHPDMPHAKANHDLSRITRLQAKLLEHAVTLVKPGGRLVYCTCSLFPEEGEKQIRRLLARQDKISVQEIDTQALGLDRKWLTKEGGLRLRPDYWADIGGMDGFYIAALTIPR